jgi:hypothetical protein
MQIQKTLLSGPSKRAAKLRSKETRATPDRSSVLALQLACSFQRRRLRLSLVRADTERHARAPSSRRRITRDGTTRGLRVVRDPSRGDVHTV